MSLPQVKPQGPNPTAQDFVSMQTTWAKQLDPVVQEFNEDSGILIGMVMSWGGNSIPNKYLQCSGQTVLQTQYQPLFQIIGTRFNTGGEPAGSFRLPVASGSFALLIRYQQ